MKRAIVTGGAGFIGNFLCEALLGKGSEVICVDNLITGERANIERLLPESRFRFVEADITEPFDIPADYIFNLASPASPVDYYAYSVETMMVNAIGTYNCLLLAEKHGARLLLTSTSEVYGDPLVHPQPEEYWGNVNPVGLRSCYDEAKRFAEALTVSFAKDKPGLEYVIIRIFNTFGPRMRVKDGRVVPNFISQALAGEPLTVYGSGEQTRSFCYIDDMVEALMRAMFLDKCNREVINVGNPEEMSVLELADVIRELTGSRSGLEFFPLPADDPKERRPVIEKAARLLDWKPSCSAREGLEKTIAWFKTGE